MVDFVILHFDDNSTSPLPIMISPLYIWWNQIVLCHAGTVHNSDGPGEINQLNRLLYSLVRPYIRLTYLGHILFIRKPYIALSQSGQKPDGVNKRENKHTWARDMRLEPQFCWCPCWCRCRCCCGCGVTGVSFGGQLLSGSENRWSDGSSTEVRVLAVEVEHWGNTGESDA